FPGAGPEPKPDLLQLLDELPVLLVAEPLRDRLRALGADPLDLGDLLRRSFREPVDRPEMPGDILRRHPADVRDVEPEEDPRERRLLRALDRRDRARGALLGEAVELEQLLLRQAVEAR